jgi:hypothetical protein
MIKIGKKGKEWIRDRAKLIKETVISGRITIIDGEVWGKCEDCGGWYKLDPDHKKKRSQGGTNDKSNIAWICRRCHNLRDNLGDPMNKKIKKTKVNWQVEHECVNCKYRVRSLICTNCGKFSIKK